MFNNKYCKQVDGVAVKSPLDPALANIFMCSFETKWLRDCPNDFKPVFFIDVISMLYLYCFLLLIMQINLRSICHLNIPT